MSKAIANPAQIYFVKLFMFLSIIYKSIKIPLSCILLKENVCKQAKFVKILLFLWVKC